MYLGETRSESEDANLIFLPWFASLEKRICFFYYWGNKSKASYLRHLRERKGETKRESLFLLCATLTVLCLLWFKLSLSVRVSVHVLCTQPSVLTKVTGDSETTVGLLWVLVDFFSVEQWAKRLIVSHWIPRPFPQLNRPFGGGSGIDSFLYWVLENVASGAGCYLVCKGSQQSIAAS